MKIRFLSRMFPWEVIMLVVMTGGIFLFFSGCVYEESPPASYGLIERLAHSRTSLTIFSFDLNSPMMIPYYTRFGKEPLATNIVSRYSDVTITFPLLPMRPRTIALQLTPEASASSKGYARVLLNGKDIGFMGIAGDFQRKVFPVGSGLWNPNINELTVHVPSDDISAAVDCIWLSESKSMNTEELNVVNDFTGYIVFPVDQVWEEGIFLSPGSELSIPVRLTEPTAYFSCAVLADAGKDLLMTLRIITARRFTSEPPLETEIAFKYTGEWLPIRWNVSERHGRHAILAISNRGASAVILRDAIIGIQ